MAVGWWLCRVACGAAGALVALPMELAQSHCETSRPPRLQVQTEAATAVAAGVLFAVQTGVPSARYAPAAAALCTPLVLTLTLAKNTARYGPARGPLVRLALEVWAREALLTFALHALRARGAPTFATVVAAHAAAYPMRLRVLAHWSRPELRPLGVGMELLRAGVGMTTSFRLANHLPHVPPAHPAA